MQGRTRAARRWGTELRLCRLQSWAGANRHGTVDTDAGVAEWLGTGLQSRLRGFESRHSLGCIEAWISSGTSRAFPIFAVTADVGVKPQLCKPGDANSAAAQPGSAHFTCNVTHFAGSAPAPQYTKNVADEARIMPGRFD